MLAIRYAPKQFESVFSDEITLGNDMHEISRLSEFLKTATTRMQLDSSLASQLRLAVEEAVVNVIDYAYPADTHGDIRITILSDKHQIKVVIADHGVPFDPTEKEKADTSLSAEERPIGGLGLLLVRELMDTINYERIQGQNTLTLIKNIS